MQALPHWSPEVPGHALTLGLLAFALEEDALAGLEQAQTGAAVSAAFGLYAQGEYLSFLNLMRGLRYEAARLGASHA